MRRAFTTAPWPARTGGLSCPRGRPPGGRTVLIVLVMAVGAAVVAILRGGSLDSLAATVLRWRWLLVAGFGAQIVFDLWSPAWMTPRRALLVVVLSYLAILAFIALNRRLPGVLLADLGLALNLTVIVVNGAMPVSLGAARAAGLPPVPRAAGIKHERLSRSTVLPWLADVVPVPVVGTVISMGDIVLACGIARLVYARTLDGRANDAATQSPASG
jgi:hypothetical protein